MIAGHKMEEKYSIPDILKILENKDQVTLIHSSKVQRYMNLLIPELIIEHIIKKDDIPKLWLASIIHDFGKIFIPGEILSAKRKLSSEEYKIVKTHPVHGYNLLRQLSIPVESLEAVKFHHERWDGKTDCNFPGYPDGLKNGEIPLYARIICICDCYDAMVSERPYKKPVSYEIALKIIREEEGNQFDPIISELFIKIIKQSAASGNI